MKFIIMPRGCGKTTWACKEAARLNCPILTAHNPALYKQRCKELGLPPVAVRTVQDLMDRKFFSAYVIIDDIDDVIKEMLSCFGIVPILGTLSLDCEPYRPPML
jgi:hypothetical protein